MADAAYEEPLSNVEDSSFVILCPGSLPNEGNDEGLCENSNAESLVNNGGCCSKCGFPEETIKEKLNELVKENCHLKETLRQNNFAIKSQLNTFFMWQLDVLKTHETHKQKFLETKDLIIKLRTENLNLKKQLQKSSDGFSFSSTGDTNSQINEKLCDSDKLKKRLKDCENISSEPINRNVNLNTEKQELVKELEFTKNEVLRLKKELEKAAVENLFLKDTTANLEEGSKENIPYKSLPNAEASTLISILSDQLQEEKGKILKLKEALSQTKSNNSEEWNTQMSTTDELSRCIDTVDDMNHSLDKQKQTVSIFNNWVALTEENQNDLMLEMCDLDNFKSYLNLEENAFKRKKKSFTEALKKQCTKLLEDHKILQQQLNTVLNQNFEKYREEIVSLSTELQAKDKELTLKQLECNRLKEELEKLNLEWGEKVSILQIQADIYQNDFYHEREAKDALRREREQAVDRVEFLLSYLKEVAKSQGNHHNENSRGMNAEERCYRCPKCLISFSNIGNLDDHVYQCFDLFLES